MQIDYALILSAGLGTRMGEIGRNIPKVMWPILDRKLIDLQIDYCRDLGVDKIFINTHYLSEVIEDHIKKNYDNSIVLLHENPLLDSGGAIHNLAQQKNINYKGNLLTVNGDQFLFFEKNYFNKAISMLSEARAVLFAINASKEDAYNETVLSQDKLIDIRKNSGERDFITFSGLGLIKLDGLKPEIGPTKFFKTVANYELETVKMILPTSLEYWDFGTASIYYRSISSIIEKRAQNLKIHQFLKSHKINLDNTQKFYQPSERSIDLEMLGRFTENSLIFKNIKQSI